MLDLLRSFLDFVAAHPHWAYALGFLAALLEALPILGAVAPGSLVIVALGAMVPTGAIHVWPLTGWAVLGAVIGDGLSYAIGRRYGRAAGAMTVTDEVSSRLLRLPLFYDLTEAQVAGIAAEITAFFG